ncbi:hypothetical protein ACLESO_15920 [Pyxidicoccus sp. 3LG]
MKLVGSRQKAPSSSSSSALPGKGEFHLSPSNHHGRPCASGNVGRLGSPHGDNIQRGCYFDAENGDKFDGGYRPTKGPGSTGTGKGHGDYVLCRDERRSDGPPVKQKPLDRLRSLLQRLLEGLRPQKPQAGGPAPQLEADLPGGRVKPTMFGSSHSDNVSKGPVPSGNA